MSVTAKTYLEKQNVLVWSLMFSGFQRTLIQLKRVNYFSNAGNPDDLMSFFAGSNMYYSVRDCVQKCTPAGPFYLKQE